MIQKFQALISEGQIKQRAASAASAGVLSLCFGATLAVSILAFGEAYYYQAQEVKQALANSLIGHAAFS